MRSDQYSSIEALAREVSEEISLLEGFDCPSKIAASAYDTAWVAMVEDPNGEPGRPMFRECLEWILQNQKEEGFWGECDANGIPTLFTLPSTLASVIALKKWNIGSVNVAKGLAYVAENTQKLLELHSGEPFPAWFAIIFPAIVELATVEVGLDVPFSAFLKGTILDLSYKRQQILESMCEEKLQYPLLAYLEALPSAYDLKEEEIVKNTSADGSLFQSPSATARAFMLTRNANCLSYLRTLVRNCPSGVPMTYPLDNDLIKLSIVNELERRGLAEHFSHHIDATLKQVYSNYKNQKPEAPKAISSIAADLYKDSLAFRILRMHGFSVSPQTFCWFRNDQKIQEHVQRNNNHFWSVMLNVYRAADLTFRGEYELEEVRSFSRELLEKSSFHRMIEHELSLPWIARMEHLEHRMWIEDTTSDALWEGKAGLHRWSSSFICKLRQLARKNFEFRQSVYQEELVELKRWTKEKGLTDLGFAREKTAYCYFAMAASTSLPHDSAIRKILAKSAILVVVVDDFFDVKGSLEELQLLTNALERWDPKGLTGHSKTLFHALDDLVMDISQHLKPEESDLIGSIRCIWFETLASWLKEAVWAKHGLVPSTDEYLENARISVAIHTIALPASCLLNPSIPREKMKPANFDALTKLLMISCRLLNDFRGYKREQEQGKLNSVLLHLRENPNAEIEDSVAYIQGIVNDTRNELLEHALMEGSSDLPEPCKRLHLSCLRFYEMFYSSANRFDSETELLQDIQKAIYLPLDVEAPQQLKSRPKFPLPCQPSSPNSTPKKYQTVNSRVNLQFKPFRRTNSLVSARPISIGLKMSATMNIGMPTIHKPSFL